MAIVTVAGAHGQTVALKFDTQANAVLAQKLAAAITAGVQGGTILPAVDTDGPPPTLPGGATGEFVQTKDGLTILPHGYKAVVDTANQAVIFGSGDNGESVLSSIGNLTFIATGGSGTVAAGGGNNRIVIPGTDKGDWSINTGTGNDVILATGAGNDTINPGGGDNSIQLGGGKDVIQSTGNDTILGGSGSETIAAFGQHSDLIYGNSSNIYFVGTEGSTTIFGGSGSDTFFGGSGPDLIYGGSGGNNFLFAGTGKATLFGGGNGDQLFANGSQDQALHAGAGNETLFGGFASGADTFYGGSGHDVITIGSADTFVAGTGTATVTAGLGSDRFVFTDGEAGGKATITGFTQGSDKIDLQGYGKDEVAKALASQDKSGGSDSITLSDHTKITFVGINSLTASDFVVTGGTGGGDHGGGDHGGGDDDHGHGHGGDHDGHGHGMMGDDDHGDHGAMRDQMFKHS